MKKFRAHFSTGVTTSEALDKLPNITLHQLFINCHLEGSSDSVTSDLDVKNYIRKGTEKHQE